MKKRVLAVLLSAAVAVSMVAATAATAFAADTVKIGVYEPASGDNGAGGKQETLGIQYANSVQPTVEIDGKEYNVELDIVDNESSNDKGPSAASKLVSDGVSVVLGSYGSSVAIAASDIFKQGSCNRCYMHQSAGNSGKYSLFPYLFPGSFPGYCTCKLCK